MITMYMMISARPPSNMLTAVLGACGTQTGCKWLYAIIKHVCLLGMFWH